MSMSENWINVCEPSDLVDNSGVCALIDDVQVAIFKICHGDEQHLYAMSNWDPIGKANVMYRGLVGSVMDEPFVASPLYKQRYKLTSGECVDDESIQIAVYPARIVDQQVQLQIVN
ncbi:nitrite reductase small subunit NirD [Aliiglaciecola sp. 3_MG-2023]|uniref:nitrite reductase small subunit NirD n=1 Tax=Aliiglaciecola sp. 3_MG-2023 TaxID=3062644 RepID=UPI0026E2F750|nr:nitrite reductase small subunit NirD [Aliiglaciecola sp. 3_MG-2023]MDO6695161.1 nitrite reductase small subunit NirD [Aliiglaciecola sp. 3_MG-2023]